MAHGLAGEFVETLECVQALTVWRELLVAGQSIEQAGERSARGRKAPVTDKEKKPPQWAYADEWPDMPDTERAIRLSFLCGMQAGLEGRGLNSYPLPPQVGDIVQYASEYWQFGHVKAIDGDRMLVWRGGTGRVGPSERWKPIANAVKVVGRRGVEPQRTA